MDNKIAVIGMAGRFPDAVNLTEFYNNLLNAKSSITDISANRVKRTTLDPGETYHRRGYIDNIDEFDYEFFGIPYGEAINMDPHQRLLLEVVAEAIENCGYSIDDFSDTDTAVFVANRNMQYYQHAEQFDPTLVTGNASEFLAARINRVFNLKGGVAVIDTSCSSGLVALHHACNELRLGQAEQAFVCGVNLELFPFKNGVQHIEVDSPDGYSIPFTAKSNGMVYGEAVICVVLKPLVKALQDKDHIQAIISGSAVNNNAAKAASLTAPDSTAQAEVLKKAWTKAGIDPDMLSFIEAHGSGTQLGDSLEIAGIDLAVEYYTVNNLKIPVSTVKSNIGHTRSVAGLAGFVKAVLSVKHKMLIPSVYIDPPNPHLNIKNSHISIQKVMEKWNNPSQHKMIAGISSIGFSGTNCHVVIEQNTNVTLNGVMRKNSSSSHLFVFSSWMENELMEYIRRVETFLPSGQAATDDVGFTLGKGRKHYDYRKAFAATDLSDLKKQLAEFLNGKKTVKINTEPKLIFILSPGDRLDYSIIENCCAQDTFFNERYHHYLQKIDVGMAKIAPNLFPFIFQITYYDYLKHHGIETSVLLGIGTGQLITRTIRGEISLEDGLKKIYEMATADNAETDLEERVERLLKVHAAQKNTIFIDLGMGSTIYPILNRHPQHGESFIVHTIPESPVLDIVNLQMLLYEKNYSNPQRFFSNVYGKRIELPAHPFVKTRCWIRNEPKKKSNGTGVQPEDCGKTKETSSFYSSSIFKLVSGLWLNLGGIPNQAPDTHFFEDGGDSIKATRVIQQLNKILGIRIDFEDLFDYPTLKMFSDFVYTRLSTAQKLLLIWKDVLGLSELTTADNFFERGGHSLLANQILNRMKAELNVRIDFEDFFRHPSVDMMLEFLEQKKQAAVEAEENREDVIRVAAIADVYPVSHLQRRLWILSQQEDGSVAYNEFNAFNLEGNLNIPALGAALEYIVRRHESFRTIFIDSVDGPVQKIIPYNPVFDLFVEDQQEKEISPTELAAIVKDFSIIPFLLSEGPLFRTKLVRLEEHKSLFLFNIHHIIFDEWSNGVFISELIKTYTEICKGRTPMLPPLRIQYKDFSVWLRDNYSKQLAADQQYWLGRFSGGVRVLDLPTDMPRPPAKTYNGSAVTIRLPQAAKEAVDKITGANNTSTFMSVVAITSVLLNRYCNQQEIILGTPVAGRKHVDVESGIGFYANTVLLKSIIGSETTFSALLMAVKEDVLGAYRHQMYPFDALVEQLDIRQDRSRTPLFDVMIGYQKTMETAGDSFQMNGVNISFFGQPRVTSKVDLSVDFLEDATSLSLTITYNTDLFFTERIERMATHFCLLAERLAADANVPVTGVEFLTVPEKGDASIRVPTPPSASAGVYPAFRQCAEKNPDSIAVFTDSYSLCYSELNNQVKHIAAVLYSKYSVKEESRVRVLLKNPSAGIITMVALARLGAIMIVVPEAYHPIQASADLFISDIPEGSGIAVTYDSIRGEDMPASFEIPDSGSSFSVHFYHSDDYRVSSTDILEYINCFSAIVAENDRCLTGRTVSRSWVENVWTGLCNNCALYLDNIPGLAVDRTEVVQTQPVNGWLLNDYELQLFDRLDFAELYHSGLRWILVEGASFGGALYNKITDAGVVLKMLFRPSAYAPVMAEIELVGYPLMLKNISPFFRLSVRDSQGNKSPFDIDNFLYYQHHASSDVLQKTAVMCRRLADERIMVTGADGCFYERQAGKVSALEISAALFRGDGVGQASVLPPEIAGADGMVAFVATASLITKQEENKTTVFEVEAIEKPATADDLEMIDVFNNTEVQWPNKNIIDYLREWAVLSPQKNALSCMGETLTYGELDKISDIAALKLRERNVQQEEIIPVFMRRSVNLVVAILGIFKSGTVYLPVGIDVPAERIIEIIKDCKATTMLVSKHDMQEIFSVSEIESIGDTGVEMLDILELLSTEGLHTGLHFPAPDPSSLAYLIYTSGSTGRPKGVMIEHAGMMNHLHAKVALFKIDSHTKVIQNAPQGFDISIWQLLCMFVAGGQTIIYPDHVVENIRLFTDAILRDKPNMLELVPSYLSLFMQTLKEKKSGYDWVPGFLLVTGEAFPPKLASEWFDIFPAVPLVNAYGPTEASDDVTHYVFTKVDHELPRLPIGRPVANMKIYIVDKHMNICPVGVAGEICVAGIGVGRGYLGQPEKSAEVFIDNPWNPGERMYKTGDLGYYDQSGNAGFLGRKDHQVKINGHRIETSEIEHRLAGLENVTQAIVLPFRSAEGSDFLAAYLLTTTLFGLSPAMVKELLKEKLPPYMVPSYIFFLDRFPVTQNGKVDRKAFANPGAFKRNRLLEVQSRRQLVQLLPEYKIPERIIATDRLLIRPDGRPDWSLMKSILASGEKDEIVMPETPIEKELAVIWQEILGIDDVGAEDDFFEKGGHSLKGMRMLAAIESKYGIRINLRHLFSSPTIRQLALYLHGETAEPLIVITRQPEQLYYPVSYAQYRMWVITQLGQSGSAYNIPGSLHITGEVSYESWNSAWKQLINRHEILRTIFLLKEGEVMQHVLQTVDDSFDISFINLTKSQYAPQDIEQIYKGFEKTAFNLEQAPLVKGCLIKTADREFVFIYVMHHIIADEWSVGILGKELLQLYIAAAYKKEFRLEPLLLQYRDYAVFQRDDRRHDRESSRNYWIGQFSGQLPVLDLPVDRARPPVKSYSGGTRMDVFKSMSGALIAIGSEVGASLFMTLTATVKLFLYRYCQQDDIIIGTSVSGRSYAGLQNGVGLYLNTIALRTRMDKEEGFNDLLYRVKQGVMDAFTHDDYPFDKLIDELDLTRNMSHAALFDVMLVMHDEDVSDIAQETEGWPIAVKPYRIASNSAKFDLNFHFRQNGNDLEVGLNYNADLFSEERAKLMLRHYENLLKEIIRDTKSAVYTLSYLDDREQAELTVAPAAVKQIKTEHNICSWITERWKNIPQKYSLIDQTGRLSFDELDSASNRLAHYLTDKHKVGAGQIIGIFMDRSTELIISMLAIIKSGASYLPLDKSFPVQRLQYMLADSSTEMILADEDFAGAGSCIRWDDAFRRELDGFESTAMPMLRDADSTAYVIYTSGTSGRPKGMRICDRSLLNYAAGIESQYNLYGEALRGLLASSIAFDLGYTCLWGMLLLGGELHLLPQTDFWQPLQVLELIEKEKINFIKLTPSHFRLLAYEIDQDSRLIQMADSLRWIILGGEKLPGINVVKWLKMHPHCIIANHYGPTETTIGVLTQLISNDGRGHAEMSAEDFLAQPVLGRPMGGHQAYIVDRYGKLCGIGVWGELWIAGKGLSTGYINNAQLNKEKFVDNPFSPAENKWCYRTGDKCRRLLNGKIEFSGRLDAQVQLKGYRIELEEIEGVLLMMDEIRQAVVVISAENDEPLLVAYIVPDKNQKEPDLEKIRVHTSRYLPAYMIPGNIISLDELPLTGNGKIDRNRLPARGKHEAAVKQIIKPVNKPEEDLVNVFSQIMGSKEIGTDSHFFELGGDSIKAIQVASKLYRMGWKLDIKDIFDSPVVSAMALCMKPVKKLCDQGAVEGRVQLVPIQQDFFDSQLFFEHHYNQSVLLRIDERINESILKSVIQKVMEHHDALRMVFRREEGGVVQFNRDLTAEAEVSVTDLSSSDDLPGALTKRLQAIQESFILDKGPLFKAAVFRLPQEDRLFLVAHHLIVDGVSWRILLEDIGSLYEQAVGNRPPQLPPKTESFKTWSEQLRFYADSSKVLLEQSYWYNMQGKQDLIWKKNAGYSKDVSRSSFELDETATRLLLTSVQRAYHTEINDIFLSVLSLVIGGLHGQKKIWIALEGHGREDIIPVDISRTVGWFTSVFPVDIDIAEDKADIGIQIRLVKEKLRSIPQKGVGYGIVKYLTGSALPVAMINPEIVFNYLGQFDDHIQRTKFSFAEESMGTPIHSREKIQYPLAISGRIASGKLKMTFECDSCRITEEERTVICTAFESKLRELIDYCMNKKDNEYMPSDFQYKEISQQAFESLFD